MRNDGSAPAWFMPVVILAGCVMAIMVAIIAAII